MFPLRASGPSMAAPEIRQHGDYRARRLVLEAWDRMDANGEFTTMGM